jgi:23S rRNA pseudouridine1911/1915/1917 synthase
MSQPRSSRKSPTPLAAKDAANVGSEHTVSNELGGQLLDAVVRTLFSATWGKARAWIATGKVTVDGSLILDATRRVRPGATVVLAMAAPKPRPGGELARDAVVHLDAHVILVDKPSGVSTVPFDASLPGAGKARTIAHDDATTTLDALVRDFLERTQKLSARAGGRASLGVVHRIDKETSGLVVFTRTWQAKQSLTAQFRAHTTHRRYFALVHGRAASRTFRTHIIENRGDGLRGSLELMRGKRKGEQGQGQLAVTHVEVVEELNGATLVACRLETGRTHQIRIHLSEVGHPLVGERVYSRGFAGPEIPAPRLMLHAAELGFTHPSTEELVRWERPWPKDFEETIGRLRATHS